MGLGSDTAVVNGIRVTTPTWDSYNPLQYGQQTTGVPNVSPTSPPFIGVASGGAGSGLSNVGGYGTSDNNGLVAATANAHPWNWKVSPVLWAVALLIGGLVLLKAIHWRETTLEGFDERGRVGDARESASESA